MMYWLGYGPPDELAVGWIGAAGAMLGFGVEDGRGCSFCEV